ncbi:MAG: protein kinase [Planctomycetes bacterium]|nr:protein kinase [Planctomycetota bacterium]
MRAGGDLRTFLDARETSRLEPAEAIYTLLATARGLAALHAADVIHRDVKPGNLLAACSGAVLLSACGLALAGDVTSRLTAQNQVLGTPQYVSPEHLKGEELRTPGGEDPLQRQPPESAPRRRAGRAHESARARARPPVGARARPPVGARSDLPQGPRKAARAALPVRPRTEP